MKICLTHTFRSSNDNSDGDDKLTINDIKIDVEICKKFDDVEYFGEV